MNARKMLRDIAMFQRWLDGETITRLAMENEITRTRVDQCLMKVWRMACHPTYGPSIDFVRFDFGLRGFRQHADLDHWRDRIARMKARWEEKAR